MTPHPDPSDRPLPDTVIRLWALSEDEAVREVESAIAQHRRPLVAHVAFKRRSPSIALVKRLVAGGAQAYAVPRRDLSDLEILTEFACVAAGLEPGFSYGLLRVAAPSAPAPSDKSPLTPEEQQDFLRAFYGSRTDGNLIG